ncbi:beta-N-acetylhexosaminidase [Candidatus Sumerlaeota bacterium]|nr:beta-N-acetylhexosaminidase [Candidatus Sumerlaeota bacterium]
MTIFRTARQSLTATLAGWMLLFSGQIFASPGEVSNVHVVPAPLLLEYGSGRFGVEQGLNIFVKDKSGPAFTAAELLREKIATSTGLDVEIKHSIPSKAIPNSIQLLATDTDDSLGDEGYTINVTSRGIIARAPKAAGLLYAAETIRQLFPAELESKAQVPGLKLSIPALTIIDKPRFKWRGCMLDCSRHFMEKEFIFHYLQVLAYYKINVFHWHLTDDQGWRLEIRKYPRLTEFGAWRKGENGAPFEDGKTYGGFYTQEDVRDVIAFARKLNIRVIPEIEMPGHSSAAIASYPYLSCNEDMTEVRTEWGIEKTILCAGKESVFEFEENVLAEVAELFPDEYVHIGGDEALKDKWKQCPRCQARIKEEGLKDEQELQSYFVKRIEKILNKHGKKMIGWDEIYQGGLSSTAVVQYWNHDDYFRGAIANGNHVVTSPTKFAYFDYPESENTDKPKWMRVTPLSKVYSFDPIIEGVEPWQEHLVLGGEAPLWTEHAPQERVEFQILPRLAAFSEVLWSRRGPKDYEDFLNRLDANYLRLDVMGIKYNPFEKENRGKPETAVTPAP